MRRPVLSFLCILALAACGGGGNREYSASTGGFTGSGLGGKTVVDDHKVNWGEAPGGTSKDGLTPMLFLFASDAGEGLNGVTEDDWAREAARQGISVQLLKNVRGPDVFLSPEGEIWPCTYFAVKAGRCKHAPALPLERRAEIARKLVEQDGRCRWAGFDPAFHRARASSYGAESASLHVRVACG